MVRNETDAAAGAGHRLNDAKVIGSKTVANSLHILTQRGFGDSEFVAEIGKWKQLERLIRQFLGQGHDPFQTFYSSHKIPSTF